MEPAFAVIPPGSAHDAAAVLARLRRVLGDVIMPEGNGTPVADAVYALFCSEARQRGSNAALVAWRALTEVAIRDLAGELEKLLFRAQDAEFELPAGTPMWDYMHGCVSVGAEKRALDVDRLGLHPLEELLAPGGSNLDRLVAATTELASERCIHGLGRPRLVCRNDPGADSHRLQFPLHLSAAEVVLEYNLSFSSWGYIFSSFSAERIEEFANKIVAGMAKLQAEATNLADALERIGRAAEEATKKVEAASVHAITVEPGHLVFSQPLHFKVEFKAWDRSFRRGIVVQEHVDPRNPSIDTALIDRAAEVGRVHADGATGWIEPVAWAIAQAASGGAKALLKRLGSEFEVRVRLGSQARPVIFKLGWDDGVIRASSSITGELFVAEGRLKIRNTLLPEQVLLALPGQPLSQVFDQPFSSDARIISASAEESCLSIQFDNRPLLANCEEGRAWRSKLAH